MNSPATGSSAPSATPSAATPRGSDPPGLTASSGSGAAPASGAAGGVRRDWRRLILDQAAARDHHADCLAELYEQYWERVQAAFAAHTACGTGPCPSPGGDGSPLLGPQAAGPAGLLEPLELPRAAGAAGGSEAPGALAAGAGAQPHEWPLRLRKKDQEIAALEMLLKERGQELADKEGAHAEVCRHATGLGRANGELQEQLRRTQELLLARTTEVERLRRELRHVQGEFGTGVGEVAPLPPASQQHYLKIHEAELTCIAAAGMQPAPLPRSLVAVGTADGYVKVLDGEAVRLHGHSKVSRDSPKLVAVDLAPGGGLLLAASADRALRLLDLRLQRLVHTLRGHRGDLSACGFLRGGAHAFTASGDRTLKLWDLERGQTLRSITASAAVTGASAHPASGLLAAGHADGGLAVWDPRVCDALPVPTPSHGGRNVVGVRLSPDGRSLLSQAEDGTVWLTSLETMRPLLTLDGLGPVTGPSPPAYSPDGALLLARGAESLACWSAGTGERLHCHETQAPVCVCWDLACAVSAHRDGHAAVWGPAAGAADGAAA